MTAFIAIVVLLILLGLYVGAIYNKLVRFKNRYLNGFAQIEVQLKRRYDLIPNLVETAKGYLKHERETLQRVTEARNTALAGLKAAAAAPGGAAMAELARAEGQLGAAMGQLSIVMEQYPDLKANQNMMQLTEEITATENKVAFSRQAFNDQVMTFNSYRQSFPQILLAPAFGHPEDAKLLEFEDSAAIQAAPKVSF